VRRPADVVHGILGDCSGGVRVDASGKVWVVLADLVRRVGIHDVDEEEVWTAGVLSDPRAHRLAELLAVEVARQHVEQLEAGEPARHPTRLGEPGVLGEARGVVLGNEGLHSQAESAREEASDGVSRAKVNLCPG
jgi:hypothetical protein